MTEHDESCTCGENHEEVMAEAMPEMMVLRLSNEVVNTEDFDLSRAMGTVAAAISGDEMERLMQFAQIEGMSPREAVHNFGAAMLVRGIFMGCIARNFYADKFGTVETPTDEEVSEAIERANQQREVAVEGIQKLDLDNLPPGLREALEKAGLDLNKVGVMAMEISRDDVGRFQKPESASKEEPPAPGMYL